MYFVSLASVLLVPTKNIHCNFFILVIINSLILPQCIIEVKHNFIFFLGVKLLDS